MVNSLTNGPNGGEPVMARKPARNSAPENGTRCRAPRTSSVDLAAVGAVDVARRQEQHALGQAVVDHVQQGAVHRQAADADAQDQDAHVLDAGVGQHALEVALPHHEDRGDSHRQEAHEDHDLAGEIGFGAGPADLIEPQDGQKGAARRPAGEQHADDPGGLAVGVRLPGVHRRQAHLGAVADEEEARTPRAARGPTDAAPAGSSDRRGASIRGPPCSRSRRGRSDPSKARAMPTEPITRYFQVASSERAF